VDGLVNPLWVKDEADGEQHEHLVRLLVDLVVLVGLRLRGSQNKGKLAHWRAQKLPRGFCSPNASQKLITVLNIS
jgi:hypothetical protein